jgi:GTP-binding protein EngB required for normal cell division
LGSNSFADMKMLQHKVFFIDAPGYGFATGVSKS